MPSLLPDRSNSSELTGSDEQGDDSGQGQTCFDAGGDVRILAVQAFCHTVLLSFPPIITLLGLHQLKAINWINEHDIAPVKLSAIGIPAFSCS
jgi:hypothetical protein